MKQQRRARQLILALLCCCLCSCHARQAAGLSWQQKAADLELEELEIEIKRALEQNSLNEVINGYGSRDEGGGRCERGGQGWSRTDEATRWVLAQDQELRQRLHDFSVAEWNFDTNMTEVNSKQYESVQNEFDAWWAGVVDKARQYLSISTSSQGGVNQVGGGLCNKTTVRLLEHIVYRNAVPLAKNPQTSRSINSLVNKMSSIFSTATVSSRNGSTLRLDPELTQLMSTSRDPDELKWAWLAWHNSSGPPTRPLYVQLVDLMNEAARDNGFQDVGESWKQADFETVELEQMLDDLYAQVKPFYEQLHAYVRSRLVKAYPGSLTDSGSIPVHLLGDMWGQQWDEIFALVAPYPEVSAARDVTGALKRNGYTVSSMFRTAEQFFASLGLEPMTSKFWERSVMERVPGVPMACHGSAHDFYTDDDFRIKMCTTITAADFSTIHHEMGHVQYYMQYRTQPALYRTGANAAFHEAVGDTIALSVGTPKHLQALGLFNQSEQSDAQGTTAYKQKINYQLQMALQKVAFLPFAYVMDRWRFAVFRGAVKSNQYNEAWWSMREQFGGIKAPVQRSEADFDPGAKFHVPNNVPYSRYFLSFIGQFQFHEALCRLAGQGQEEELSLCDIYQSEAAGNRLRSVLSYGASKPWPEVMKEFTGQSEFNVSSLLRYFRPLIRWLKRANRNSHVGWT